MPGIYCLLSKLKNWKSKKLILQFKNTQLKHESNEQTGTELCQAQVKLGLARFEVVFNLK